MITNERHVIYAKRYQAMTNTAHEMHLRIIKVFTEIFEHPEEYNHMPHNYPALKDTIETIAGDYDSVSQVEVEMDERFVVRVLLTFGFHNCQREFSLFDHDFVTGDVI